MFWKDMQIKEKIGVLCSGWDKKRGYVWIEEKRRSTQSSCNRYIYLYLKCFIKAFFSPHLWFPSSFNTKKKNTIASSNFTINELRHDTIAVRLYSFIKDQGYCNMPLLKMIIREKTREWSLFLHFAKRATIQAVQRWPLRRELVYVPGFNWTHIMTPYICSSWPKETHSKYTKWRLPIASGNTQHRWREIKGTGEVIKHFEERDRLYDLNKPSMIGKIQ